MKIHISADTKLLLENVGCVNFVVKKRGSVELRSKGFVDTFWLMPLDDDMHKITR